MMRVEFSPLAFLFYLNFLYETVQGTAAVIHTHISLRGKHGTRTRSHIVTFNNYGQRKVIYWVYWASVDFKDDGDAACIFFHLKCQRGGKKGLMTICIWCRVYWEAYTHMERYRNSKTSHPTHPTIQAQTQTRKHISFTTIIYNLTWKGEGKSAAAPSKPICRHAALTEEEVS